MQVTGALGIALCQDVDDLRSGHHDLNMQVLWKKIGALLIRIGSCRRISL